jgi:general secretion pathway protein K
VNSAKSTQRGAAVILAMITVMLCATIAAAALGDLGHSIDSAAGRQDQGQARLLARAAADWARNVLADDAMRTTVDHSGEPWAVRVPPTPVDEAEVSGEILDWSGRYNLNNLVIDGKADPDAAVQFARLLGALGIHPVRATRLSVNLLDWITPLDPDSDGGTPRPDKTRPPRGPLLDIGELTLIPGYDAALVEQIAAFAVALPAPSRINVNTAPAEVLAAITDGIDINVARVLVAERERAWFKDIADFSVRLPEGAQPARGARIDVKSQYFLVTGRASHGSAMVRMEVLLDRQQSWPEILWQRIL